MRRRCSGFTLIEIVIFLAISGLLFLGISAGVQTSLNQQQNNDTVQSFMEFLRGVYSQASNAQNPNTDTGGMSDKVIYGKLVTFGETKNLAGNDNTENAIFSYTVVGNLAESGTGSALEIIKGLNANVVKSISSGKKDYYGLAESYTPKWSAEVQPDCYNNTNCFKPLKAALLIVRHPSSGDIYTYYMKDQTVQINAGGINTFKNSLSGFSEQQVDFCLNASKDVTKNDVRYDVRIIKGAHNASGVELVPENNATGVAGGSNKCKE